MKQKKCGSASKGFDFKIFFLVLKVNFGSVLGRRLTSNVKSLVLFYNKRLHSGAL